MVTFLLVMFAFMGGAAAGAIYFTKYPFNEKIKVIEKQPLYPQHVIHSPPRPSTHQHPASDTRRDNDAD